MPDTRKTVEPGDEELAAPHRAVGAVAETVEREPDDRVDPTMLHHARGDMRVMVLHPDRGKFEFERELGREVIGMQIVRDDVGPHPVKRRQVVECLQERLIRGNVLQVTDVVTRHDVVTTP